MLGAQGTENGDPERVTQVVEREIRRRALGVRPSGERLAASQTARARAEVKVHSLLRVDQTLMKPTRLALFSKQKAVAVQRSRRSDAALVNRQSLDEVQPDPNLTSKRVTTPQIGILLVKNTC